VSATCYNQEGVIVTYGQIEASQEGVIMSQQCGI
jgi:hypothetical protein